jgi:hypothetical protein
LEQSVGIPIPRLTNIPSLSSLAALLTILSLLTFASPFPGISIFYPGTLIVLNSILFVSSSTFTILST